MGNRETIFYVLDTSGNMDSFMIGALNTAMSEVIEAFKKLSEQGSIRADLSIAAVEFNTGANWLLLPTPISDAK